MFEHDVAAGILPSNTTLNMSPVLGRIASRAKKCQTCIPKGHLFKNT